MAGTRNGATQGGMRSVPPVTAERVRSVHDVRHLRGVRPSTRQGNELQRLERLTQEHERLQQRLLTWIALKERTEAQINQVDLERRQILRVLEPRLRDGIREQQQEFQGPTALVEVMRA